MLEIRDEIVAIDRHRMGSDGEGVSTLVVFWGCPLHCKYCINDYCHDTSIETRNYTPEELFREIKIDDIYFRMSHGGVVFGGGEPIEHSRFIEDFVLLGPEEWEYRIETSLNTDWKNVRRLIPYIDKWIIDIKDTNPRIYRNYTGKDINPVIDNIIKMSHFVDKTKIQFRVPLIPEYNSKEHQKRSARFLEKYGRVELFDYKVYNAEKTEDKDKYGDMPMRGKLGR